MLDAGRAIHDGEQALHVMVLCHSEMSDERRLDEDGLETSYALNYLSNVVLIEQLKPLLARCVTKLIVLHKAPGYLSPVAFVLMPGDIRSTFSYGVQKAAAGSLRCRCCVKGSPGVAMVAACPSSGRVVARAEVGWRDAAPGPSAAVAFDLSAARTSVNGRLTGEMRRRRVTWRQVSAGAHLCVRHAHGELLVKGHPQQHHSG